MIYCWLATDCPTSPEEFPPVLPFAPPIRPIRLLLLAGVAALLKQLGQKPAFLTRGYGGTSEGPVLVKKGQSAAEVGARLAEIDAGL